MSSEPPSTCSEASPVSSSPAASTSAESTVQLASPPTSLATPEFFYTPLDPDAESVVDDIEDSLFETGFAKVQVFDEDLAVLQSQIGRKTRIAYFDGWCAVLRVSGLAHCMISAGLGQSWQTSVEEAVLNPNWTTEPAGSGCYKYDRKCQVPVAPLFTDSSHINPTNASLILTHTKEFDNSFSSSPFRRRERRRAIYSRRPFRYTEEDMILENFDAERRREEEQRVANSESDSVEDEGERGSESQEESEGGDEDTQYEYEYDYYYEGCEGSKPPAVGVQVADSVSPWSLLVDASLALSGKRALNALLTISVIHKTKKRLPPALCVDLYVTVAIASAFPNFVYHHDLIEPSSLPISSYYDATKVYYRGVKGKSEVKKLKDASHIIGDLYVPEEVETEEDAEFVRVLRIQFDTAKKCDPPCGLQLPLEVYGRESLPEAFGSRSVGISNWTLTTTAIQVETNWKAFQNDREFEESSRKGLKEAKTLEDLAGHPIIISRVKRMQVKEDGTVRA